MKFVLGRKGATVNDNIADIDPAGSAGGAGGGGSAILSASSGQIGSPDWYMLAVAGGGGGGYSETNGWNQSGDRFSGVGGRSSADGGNGKCTGSTCDEKLGGTNGGSGANLSDDAGGGGGYKESAADDVGGKSGYPDGGQGGTCSGCGAGGFGFGGGGAGKKNDGAGGGGGYSGGGAGDENAGGGGGSFVYSSSVYSIIAPGTKGGGTGSGGSWFTHIWKNRSLTMREPSTTTTGGGGPPGTNPLDQTTKFIRKKSALTSGSEGYSSAVASAMLHRSRESKSSLKRVSTDSER